MKNKKQDGIPIVTIKLPWTFNYIYRDFEYSNKKQLRLDILKDLDVKRLPKGIVPQIKNI